jgi:hypothetical protein
MKALNSLENFARTVNDHDNHLPKGRGRCFDIGIWGGCGVLCPAFVDGECEEPQEISKQDIIEEHGENDAEEIFSLYDCFKDENQR